LLVSILEQLTALGCSDIEAVGFDTDRKAIELAKSRIERTFPKVSVQLRRENFLDFALTYGKRSLFGQGLKLFDVCIANPPYVRTQVMGAKQSQVIAHQFGLAGRVDLYYAFISGIASLMRPGGIAGIIVSNRFMTTRAGTTIRRNIVQEFDVIHIWDLGDTRLFEAAVLPAVLLVKQRDDKAQSVDTGFTSIYSVEDIPPASKCSDVFEALDKEGVVELPNRQYYEVQHGKLDFGEKPEGVWRIATPDSEKWLRSVKSHTSCTFGEIGKIRVGIKTTSDEVFIRTDWDDLPEEERPELLRPIITHHVAQRFKARLPEQPRKVLYTHLAREDKCTVVDLDHFPRAARYLARHRAKLESREYVLKAGRQWYEIWVPQDPNVWRRPKVVFRDISEKPTFWMDLSGAIVNGDCYWLACDSPREESLLWLVLGVGNSTFIEEFYDHRFHNKLYAARRRFMTQYVEKFPLPNPETMVAQRIMHLAKDIYESIPSERAEVLQDELDQLVWQAFGFSK